MTQPRAEPKPSLSYRVKRRLGRVPTAWSIAIVRGRSLDQLVISPPLLSPGFGPTGHLTLIADPFFTTHDKQMALFFEAIAGGDSRGEIHWATLSEAGVCYRGPALRDDFHLSFPYVFYEPTRKKYYMVPETSEIGEIRLYSANVPGDAWTLERTLASGRPYVDSVLLKRDHSWFLITECSGGTHNHRQILWAPSLESRFIALGDWRMDPAHCRMAGRLVPRGPRSAVLQGTSVLTQDCSSLYGRSISQQKILFSPDVDDPELPHLESVPFLDGAEILTPSPSSWATARVHTADLRVHDDGVFGVTDGRGRLKHWQAPIADVRSLVTDAVSLSIPDLP